MKDENDSHTQPLPLGNTPPYGFRGKPPMAGWWLARRVHQVGATFTSRRWWNGNDWSRPVHVGAPDSEAEEAQLAEALVRPDDIEWLGLARPATFYPYLLEEHDGLKALAAGPEELQEQALALELKLALMDEVVASSTQRRTFNYE